MTRPCRETDKGPEAEEENAGISEAVRALLASQRMLVLMKEITGPTADLQETFRQLDEARDLVKWIEKGGTLVPRDLIVVKKEGP